MQLLKLLFFALTVYAEFEYLEILRVDAWSSANECERENEIKVNSMSSQKGQ